MSVLRSPHLEGGPGNDQLCPVCFWEDDSWQLRWPLSSDGANGISLAEAQHTYLRTGVIASSFRRKVRKPRRSEPLDPGWRPYDHAVDGFDDGIPHRGDTWPRDMTTLYWWRPGYWRGDPFTGAPSTDEGTPAHELILRVRSAAPETADLIDVIENRYGGPAPFPVCTELADFVVAAYRGGRAEVADRVVGALDPALHEGSDAFAHNCVSIAFLENDEWEHADLAPHLSAWPPAIRSDIETQLTHRRRAMSGGPPAAVIPASFRLRHPIKAWRIARASLSARR